MVLIIGCLALAGFPGMSGFFSKDEIIGVAFERGGMYAWMGVVMYGAAFLTAFYSFRIGFRVVAGEPVRGGEGARSRATSPTASTENPATGEREDTDVGFPGPEHHIAERELPMKVPMAILAVLSVIGGAGPDPRASTT